MADGHGPAGTIAISLARCPEPARTRRVRFLSSKRNVPAVPEISRLKLEKVTSEVSYESYNHAADGSAGTASVTAFGADTISAEDFVNKAAEAGMAEVQMGKLGMQKSGNADVRAFSQQMMTDHSKANKELMAVAKSKNLEVPTEPGMVHKGLMEKYEHQSADADFNRDFMQRMIKDHEAAVKLFQTAASDTTLDPELRSFAKKTLPTLQQHLSEAQQLEAKLAKKT